MVNLKIDGFDVSVPEGTTIMEAAASVSIDVPSLCYLKDINEIAACRVCVVEVEGKDRLMTSCNNVVEEGMNVKTNSVKVNMARRQNVQLILSQHENTCAVCVRSGNCSLQKVANDLNIWDIPFKESIERVKWDKKYPLLRDSKKCIKCMRCINVCDKIQSLSIWDVISTGARTSVNVSGNKPFSESDCSLCGQCITHCPCGALRERDDTDKLWDAISDPNKIIVAQVAPAVRTAWAEYLNIPQEKASVNKIFDALKKMGVDYVFDTSYSADLTIMEEATEFIERYSSGQLKERPMFTSCCPGWIRFCKSQYPHFTKQLSTAKSPQQMFGAVIKSYFAERNGIDPEKIVTLSIMPCVAKKAEAAMPLYYKEYAGHDIDIVITTRELVRMIRSAHISQENLKDIESDSLMQQYSGAGVIFGATGGVMEAALRTASYLITGKNPDPDIFREIRADISGSGAREIDVEIGDLKLRAAIVSGLGNARKLLDAIDCGDVHYDFVEVMACPGGCVGGGGQPIHDGKELADIRGNRLYTLDSQSELRFSHENSDILTIYDTYLEKPQSHKAHMLLHTDHFTWNSREGLDS